MPTKNKTNRKTRNNRKTRKMKGGFWCIFENKYDSKCQPLNPVYDSGYYYYYLNKDTFGEKTLFAYRPHIFKHFDEFYPFTKPERNIVSVKNKFFPRENAYRNIFNIKFHVDKLNRPGNLQVFINLLNEFIKKNNLSYTKLLTTIIKKSATQEDHNISIFRDSLGHTEIWWQKKKRPATVPRQVNDTIDQRTYNSEIKYCIQITHIHDYDRNPTTNNRSYEYRNPTPYSSTKPPIPYSSTNPPIPVVSVNTNSQLNTANPRTSFDYKISQNANQFIIKNQSIDNALKKEKGKFLEDIKKIKSSSN